MWRDVEDVNVGEVVRGFFEWAFVWGPGDHDVADDPTGMVPMMQISSLISGVIDDDDHSSWILLKYGG